MTSFDLLHLLSYFEVVLCFAVLATMFAKKLVREHWSLAALLAVRGFSSCLLVPVLRLAGKLLSPHAAYKLYFYGYWGSYAVESILALLVIFNIFRLAMAPLKGLQSLGMLVFRWAGAISVAVALGSAFEPNLTTTKYLVAAVAQLQRTQSILTLCLLLFVCFAIRPMGLSYRSRIFGISLGLGVMATTSLVHSGWLSHYRQMYGAFDIVNGLAFCATLLTWGGYFALPEEKRRIIVLPTTSPFLRWNQISLALGDDPGFVAVGGVPPELFAPAELEIMRRASLKMVTPTVAKSMSA